MKISVGAMPCVIGVLSPQRFSLQASEATHTHVDLHGNNRDDDLGGVPDGEEDEEDKLHGQIKHAALDDYGD